MKHWSHAVRQKHRRAFSALELLVVLGILVILVCIFVPYVSKIWEQDHRVTCANNLRALREAVTNYAHSNRGEYPQVIHDPKLAGYVCFSGPDAADPFAPASAVKPNDVTASLWLLIRQKYASPRDFICPSADGDADYLEDANRHAVAVDRRGNFRASSNLSYSYASPFSRANDYRLNDTQRSDFVLMADRNPGANAAKAIFDSAPLELAKANSANHGQAGQNVMFADGHVDFQTTPFCGVERDNIYTALTTVPIEKSASLLKYSTGVVGPQYGPAWSSDSYLVPTAEETVFVAATQPTTSPSTNPIITTRPDTVPPFATTQPATTVPASQPVTTRPATSPTTAPTTRP